MDNLISTIKHIPSFRTMPDNMIIALFAGLAVVGVFMLFIIIMLISGYTPSDFRRHREEEEPAPTHKAILDLKEALVEEMKGTSRQNSIMIWLTIIFIAISVLGMVATLMGPEKLLKITQSITNLFSHTAANSVPAAPK